MTGSKTTKKIINRKAPLQSATLFDIGVKKKGNDGRIWQIASFNGVKRWEVVGGKKSSSKTSGKLSNSKTAKKPSNSKTAKKPSNSKTTKKQSISKTPKKSIQKNRKGPTESATSYPVGTRKKGNDGRKWIITESSSGTKRWMPVTLDTNAIKYKNDNITFFDANMVLPKLKLGKISKVGELDITSNKIGVGEIEFTEFPAKKGKYNIYTYAGSLIAVHQDEKLLDQKFIRTDKIAGSDMSSFSYWDSKRVKPYILKPYIDKSRNKKKVIQYSIGFDAIDHAMSKPTNKIPKRNFLFFYIFESDLDSNIRGKNPVAIFADNIFGDGLYPIFKGKNAYWIMSYGVEKKMVGLIDK